MSREVYSVSDLSNQDRLAAAHRSSRELHEWHASLPPHLGTVKPSTLVPSFRRQAIALQLAYSHALIHTNRPFLLTGGGSENVIECISATQASLELVNRMAGDSTLLHSFWWTHYVIFCALAVVYVWEIQRTTRPTDEIDNQSVGKMFDLAEKCHGHLKRASTGLSQNKRYSIILDELRSEAQRCRMGNPPHPHQGGRPNGENNANTDTSFPFLQDLDMFGSASVQEEMMPNILDSFLFSDWQTLDSSVRVAFDSALVVIANLNHVQRPSSHFLIQIPFLPHVSPQFRETMLHFFQNSIDRTSRKRRLRTARVRGSPGFPRLLTPPSLLALGVPFLYLPRGAAKGLTMYCIR